MTLRKILIVLLLAPLAGCTVAASTRFRPESHFVFPNSNIKTLGPVKTSMTGDVTILFFGTTDVQTSSQDRALYRKALAQHQGADMIIDYVITTKLKQFPILATWTTLEIEGTAAKMEVGKQLLE